MVSKSWDALASNFIMFILDLVHIPYPEGRALSGCTQLRRKFLNKLLSKVRLNRCLIYQILMLST